MKANELRIGNFIKHEEIIQVQGINNGEGIDDWYIQYSNNFIPIEDIEPVPLTEEWLIKFGFNRLEQGDLGYMPLDYRIALPNGGFLYACVVESSEEGRYYLCLTDYGTITTKDKDVYVHTLQNTYLGLTGLELDIRME